MVGIARMLLNPGEMIRGFELEAEDFDIQYPMPPQSRIIAENGKIIAGPDFNGS
jgi:hypothetical protein